MTAEERAQAIIDAFGDAVDWDEMHKLITLAIKAALDAERRRLIPLVCQQCLDGEVPARDNTFPDWAHRNGEDCYASPIYEAIRKEGPGDD